MWWPFKKRVSTGGEMESLLWFWTCVLAIERKGRSYEADEDLLDAIRDCLRRMLGRDATDEEVHFVWNPNYVPRRPDPDPDIPF
jgi:hypothetical protein